MNALKGFIIKIENIGFKNVLTRIYIIFKNKQNKNKSIQIDNNIFHNFSPEFNFLFNYEEKNRYVDLLITMNKKESIIADANDICNHRFTFLGMNKEFLGEKIQWNKDYRSGFVWENDDYKCIKTVDLGNNSDVKMPWELSRFQHIFTLGKAYWLSGDERYSEEYRKQIDDWIENNPVGMSVNWCCTMEVAIRAVNWIYGYYFFRNSSIESNFWNNFNNILFLHGEFIINNLETGYGYNNNHYIADIVGLIWLGLYFKTNPYDRKKTEKWFNFGYKQLIEEMYIQVNQDGTSYEASTAYHRLVTELFLLTTILCCKNNVNFPKKYINRLEKMCNFILDITKPNGYASLIGDVDNGRLIIISDYSNWVKRDFRQLLAIAGEFFNRDDMRYEGRNHKEDAVWCLDNIVESYKKPLIQSRAYSDGGFYLLKNDNFHVIIRCGELSVRGNGSHSHNDQLSIELNIREKDFIIDPGLYVYTADYKMRNLFRSTEMHNTMYVKGYEQNDYDECNLFNMQEQTFSRCISFDDNSIQCVHYGYKNKCSIIYEREISINDKTVLIMDKLHGYNNSDSEIIINFILDKDVEVFIEGMNIYLINQDVKAQLIIDENSRASVGKCYIASGYGELMESNVIKILMLKHFSRSEIKIVN